MMVAENYRLALKDAQAEEKRLSFRVAQLRATIDLLTSLLQEQPEDAESLASLEGIDVIGISGAIRQIFKHVNFALTPAQMKTKLTEAGFDLAKYANPSAVIHSTLKRLETQGEVVSVNVPSGPPTYALRPPESHEERVEFLKSAAAMQIAEISKL